MRLKSDFKVGGPISQVPISWFRVVADFINGFALGVSPIKLNIPESVSAMSPIQISFEPANDGANLDVMPRPSTASSEVPAGQELKGGWERGKKNDQDGLGFRMMVITRVVRTGDYDNFFWAWGYFDRFGMIYKVSKEQGCFSELTKEGWLAS